MRRHPVRDHRGRSPSPKLIGSSLERVLESIAPQTPLAEIQQVWSRAVGPQIDAVTSVVAERDGVVTIECVDSIWAQELEMMGQQLLLKLTSELSGPAPDLLRFRASG
jgi:predicted nucleic acid-binding Zn ribbon protein